MQFLWGAVTGFVVAAVLAFVLFRSVIVPKLEAVAKNVKSEAEQAAKNAVGHAAAGIQKKL